MGPFRFYVAFAVLRGLFLLSFRLLFKLLCSLLFLYPLKRTTCTSIRRSPGYLATHKLCVRFLSKAISHCIFQSQVKLEIISSSTVFFSKLHCNKLLDMDETMFTMTQHDTNKTNCCPEGFKKEMSTYLPTSLP